MNESSAKLHVVNKEIYIKGKANPRWGDANTQDMKRSERSNMHGYYRVIGGGEGDVYFNGYSVEGNKTILHDVAVITNLKGFKKSDMNDLAQDIVDEAYDSIGWDAIT